MFDEGKLWAERMELNYKKKCRECRFSGQYENSFGSALHNIWCDYIGKTGTRRPCPAKRCTVFQPRKKEDG